MKKSLMIVFVLVAISLLGIILFQGYLFGVNLAPKSISTCITPQHIPFVGPVPITQSGTICPGTYNYGIEIGADNLNLRCLPNTIFSAPSSGPSSATHYGARVWGWKNITLTGCSFNNFRYTGINIDCDWPIGCGANSSNIYLINVSVTNTTTGPGIEIGAHPKVTNVSIRESTITGNDLGGVLMLPYGGLGTSASQILVSNTIILSKNKISNNLRDGVDVRGLEMTSNNYRYNLNNKYLKITDNNISNNGESGIGFFGFYGKDSIIGGNAINKNGFNLSGAWASPPGGSGISIVLYRQGFAPPPYQPESRSVGLGGITSNNLIGNKYDGISLKIQSEGGYNLTNNTELDTGEVFGNFISSNNRYGIGIIGNNTLDYNVVSSYIIQNIIKNNVAGGIYFKGLSYINNSINLTVSCNDILSNGAGFSKGLQVENFASGNIHMDTYNIIESNSIGVLMKDLSGFNNLSNSVSRNYIGNNSVGIMLNNTMFSAIGSNDFNGGNIQVFDNGFNNFIHNWWDNYSSTCVDINPQDGWCDIPRQIPIANQDFQPRAGNSSWQNNLRGYLLKGSTGVISNPACPESNY